MSLSEHPALVPAKVIANTFKPTEPTYAVIHEVKTFADPLTPTSYSETILPVLAIGIIDSSLALEAGFDFHRFYAECAFFVVDQINGCASWIRKYKTRKDNDGFKDIEEYNPVNIFFKNEHELCQKGGHPVNIPRFSLEGGDAIFKCENAWKELGCTHVAHINISDIFV